MNAIENIGSELLRIREHRKMSQTEVAEKAGITYVTVGLIERNQANPSISTLESIAQALNCSLLIKFQTKE